MNLKKQIQKLLETKSAPKGFHFTKDGKLKRGDADRDGSGGPMLRSDPLDKQRSKVPPVSENTAEVNMNAFKQFRAKLEEKTLTPAEMKKREEVAKAIERENPNMPMGMKMAIATKTAKRVAEQTHTGKGSRPGWMLKADPELAKKFKEKEDIHKAKVKAYGNPAAGKLPRKPDTEYDRKVTSYLKKKYNKEEVELEEAKGLAGMSLDQLKQEHDKVKSRIEAEGKSKMISMNHPLSQRARSIRLHMAIKQKQANEEVEFANLDESVKTTHEDPLVTVHDKDGLHTHANLSTANNIFNTSVKHTDVHKGPVSVTSGREDKRKLKFAISKHHAAALKEEVDDEGSMARGQLMRMVNQASALAQMMEDDKQLDGWVQSKLTMASDYLDSVHDYLMHNKQDVDKNEEEMEEGTHYCAKHVRSTLLGDGIVLEAQHADPDEEGNIEWYMVEFQSGIRRVYTEDLEIMMAEYHGNHKKKKRMTNG